MVTASPRTLEQALATAPAMSRLKPLLTSADAAFDAAVINAAGRQSDDTAQKVGEKVSSHLQRRSQGSFDDFVNVPAVGPAMSGIVATNMAQQQRRPIVPEAPPSPMEQIMPHVESTFGKLAFLPLVTEMALPALGGVAGFLGAEGLKTKLNAPGKFLNEKFVTKTSTGRMLMNDTIQIGFSALQTYNTVKSFDKDKNTLQQMYKDITGQEIGLTALVTSRNLPPIVSTARDHFVKEYASRGIIQAVGWALVARDLLKSRFRPHKEIEMGRVGLIAGMVPGIIGMGVDMFMGTSLTEVYSGFKSAYDTGKEIPANEYAAFILASNHDFAARKVGKQVAMEIGTMAAEAHEDPAELLRQMNDGRFKARVEELVARDEAVMKEQAATAKPQAQPVSMAAKLNGAKPERENVGEFTKRLNEESKAQHQLGA